MLTYNILLGILLTITLLPPGLKIARQKFVWHEPENFVVLVVLLGYAYRSAHIVYFGSHVKYLTLSREETQEYINLCLAYIVVGMVFFNIGYYSRWFRPKLSLSVRPARLRAYRVPIALTASFGLVVFWVYLHVNGGFFQHFLNLQEYRMSGSTTFEVLVKGRSVFLAATLLYVAFRLRDARRYNLLSLLLSILSLYFFAATGGRFQLVMVLLSLLMLHHTYVKPIKLLRMLLIFVMVLMLSIALAMYRGSGLDVERFFGIVGDASAVLNYYGQGTAISLIDFFVYSVYHVPKDIDYYFGLPFIRLPLQVLPIGSILPPELFSAYTSNYVTDLYEIALGVNSHFGFSPGFFGLLYINFDLPGIMLGMLAFGVFCRFLVNTYQKYRYSPFVVAMYAVSVNWAVTWLFFKGDLFLCMRAYFVIMLSFLAIRGAYSLLRITKHRKASV